MPASQVFFYVGTLVSSLIALLFFVGRRQAQPSRLRLRENRSRSLNVKFIYNGEDFDAYEVLGLPSGASIERIERAYKQALSSSPSGVQPLLSSAYVALKMDQRGR